MAPVITCLALIGPTVSGEDSAAPRFDIQVSASRPASADIAFLRAIEDRVLPLPLVVGPPRYESLTDYYWEANVDLQYRLNEALRAFHTGKPCPFRAMTVVAGPAGIGKTFIKGGVYSNWIPSERIWKFDIRDLFGELADRGLADLKADLHHEDQVINRLLSLTPEGRKEFTRLLNTKSPAFAVVDSLDEIHPNDYHFVLTELERFALHGDRDFIHVVVFGRPLAFRRYWQNRRSAGIPFGLRVYVLAPPQFRTSGDLLVSNWNYDCWKYGLSRTDSDGKPVSMSFHDYQQWCDCGCPVRDQFADVRFRENNSMYPRVRDQLLRWAMEHRIVNGVLPNLAGNSMVREILDEHVASGMEFDERQFMEEFLHKWLERDTRSGDRPSRDKPEFLDLYVKCLEAVAAKYIDEHRVSRLGYFDVVEEDRVNIHHNDEMISVPVRTVLNRSGLVTLDPQLLVAQRYRFEPFWLHRLLLEMHHEREAREADQEQSVAAVQKAGATD